VETIWRRQVVLEVLRALGRRWYVVVVGLLVTGALSYVALRTSPPEFHARGLVLLLPSDAAVGKGGNPFLQLSGLEQPAGILVASFSSASARAEVEERSPSADYTIGIDDSTRGPVIAVDVTASSEAETMDTLNHLVARIPEELARLQAQVEAPADTAIGSMPLTVDKEADISRAGTVRMVIAALVVGLVGTGAAGYAVDALVQRRRLRASGTSDQDEDPDSDPKPEKRRRRRLAGRSPKRGETGAERGPSAPSDTDAPDDGPLAAVPTAPVGADETSGVPESTGALHGAPMSPLGERSPAGRRT
jgi:hypothetical protein